MLRLIKWILGIVLVLALIVFVALPIVLSTAGGRDRVAGALSKGLDRKVEIGDLSIGLFFSSIDVESLRIANPKGFPEGHLLRADSIDLDVGFRKILENHVEGAVRGQGIVLHIVKKDGKTNLDGLAADDEEKSEKSDGTLDLDVKLDEGRLIVEDLDKNEKLVVDGVSAELRLSNRKQASEAKLKLRVKSIDQGGVKLRDIELDASQEGDWLDVERLRAAFEGEGELVGRGRARVRGGDEWSAELEAKNVAFDDTMRPAVATFFPLASATGGQLDGRLEAAFDLKGRGLAWESIRKSLSGDGELKIGQLELGSDSLLGMVVSLAGGKSESLKLKQAGAAFRFGEGWVHFNRLSATGDEIRYDLAGKVSLQGKLDLEMDLLPLVKTFGGESKYAKVAKYVDRLPIGIEGTTEKPKLAPPKLEDLGKGAVEKGLEGALDRLKDRLK